MEYTSSMPNRRTLTYLSVSAVTLGNGYLWAAQGRLVLVYACAVISWTGYLFAHRACTGSFTDSHDGGIDVPKETHRVVGGLLGGGILIAGMVLGVYGIRLNSHALTTVAAFIFLGGYVAAHTAITDKAL